jgi:ATP-binding cassette subfamily B protein
VARLYDPGAGTVRIGGTDIRDVTLASLRETVGVVTQDTHLFHDTIRANLAYARPGATDEDLTGACRAAQIHDLIAALPDGLDTVVGDRGYRLSGGEKQILVIDGGRIREHGTHGDLLAAGGLYAELYRTQFSQQDMAAGPAR